jgi:hypothetical protein
MLLGPAIFKHEVLAFDEAASLKTCPDAVDCARVSPRLVAVKQANNRHCRLFCACRERPSGGRSCKRFDEIASSHCLYQGGDYAERDVITEEGCRRRNAVQ